MSSRPAWFTRASSKTGSKATEKPCLEKQQQKQRKVSVPKKHAEAYINYKLFGLLAQAY